MSSPINRERNHKLLLLLLAVNLISTVLHYSDNFLFFDRYPAPEWMVPSHVYIAWLILTPFAAIAYFQYRQRNFWFSYVCLSIYALASVSSMGHYFYASMGELSLKMNLFICSDVVTGIAVLSFVAWSAVVLQEWNQASS